MKPFVLPPNLLHHFYAGGRRIAEFRGLPAAADDHMPEEWIGAINSMFGDPERGLSRLEDGTYVRDAIAKDPTAFLGPEHVERWGADTGLLVKLLDAGERLPVHFHPGRAFAQRELGLSHGKTEAWIIIDAVPGARVHLGFADDVDLDTVRRWVRDQDAEAMLAAMREVPVHTGDAIFVPAGTAHAIGEGILLVELQEPTDLSITLEWESFPLTEEGSHLGLGWDRALESLDRSAWDDERIRAATGGGADGSGERSDGRSGERSGDERSARGRERSARGRCALLGADADPYFRADRITAGTPLEAGFAVLVATEGAGTLSTAAGGDQPIARGDALLVPYAAGDGKLHGDVTALRARPPDPTAAEAE